MIAKRYKNDSIPSLQLNEIQLEYKTKFEKNIQNGVYILENTNCPICESTSQELLSEKDRYGLTNNIVICRICGLIFTNPRLSQESFNKFYDNEYRKLYVGNLTPQEDFFKGQYNKAKKIVQYLKNAKPEIVFNHMNILEIGCGAGGILYYFQKNGCNVKGVDLGSEYLNYGKNKYGLNLTHGTLKNIPSSFKPDIIIYSHVLEHLVDINAELARVKKICSENTLLYIEVPGIKNINNTYKMNALLYFQNAHTLHFSTTTLTNLLNKNGFELLAGDEYIRSIFTLAEKNQKHNIINDYESAIMYLKKTERYRFLYPFKLTVIKKKLKSLITTTLFKVGLKEPLKKIFGR